MYSLTISFNFERKHLIVYKGILFTWLDADKTDKQCWQAICQLDVGRPQIDVAANIEISQSVVSCLYQRYQKMGEVAERCGWGRTWATSKADDCHIVMESLRSRTLSAPKLCQDLRKLMCEV